MLSSKAAKEWRGTCADWRQNKAPWEEQVKTFLAEHTRADQEGETTSTAERPSGQDTVSEQMQRGEQQAARMEQC
jgi:hypothetical protein